MNKYTINGDLTAIHLLYGRDLIIDTADLDKMLKHHWTMVINPYSTFAISNIKKGDTRTVIHAHRYVRNTLKTSKVAALDKNYLNCSRGNLTTVKKQPKYTSFRCAICNEWARGTTSHVKTGKIKHCSQKCGNKSRRNIIKAKQGLYNESKLNIV